MNNAEVAEQSLEPLRYGIWLSRSEVRSYERSSVSIFGRSGARDKGREEGDARWKSEHIIELLERDWYVPI